MKKSDIKVKNEEEIFGLCNEEVLGLQKSFESCETYQVMSYKLNITEHSGFDYSEPVLSNTVKSKIMIIY